MGVWACVQSWACLGERRAAGVGSSWYAGKGRATYGRWVCIHGVVLQRGNQPLHLALQGEHIEIARLLLEKGSPVNAVGEVGAWMCGHVHKHGHAAWESAWLVVGVFYGML